MHTSMTNSADCEAYLRKIWERGTIQSHERVYAVYLNERGEREMHKCICKGSYSGTSFDLREVVHYAMANHLDYVVIAHNHPSGNCMPSKEDLDITRKIYNTLCTLDIKLIDHIIITHDNYYSFKDSGIIAEFHKVCCSLRNTGLLIILINHIFALVSYEISINVL